VKSKTKQDKTKPNKNLNETTAKK